MSGVIPAIPLILIRPFLPESPAWQKKRAEGTLKRPSIAALFAPELRQTTIVTTLMFAMSYGAAFGAIQQIPQIVPGLPEVRRDDRRRPAPEARRIEQAVASNVTRCRRSAGWRAAWRSLSGGDHRQPAQADPPVPDPRADRDAVGLRAGSRPAASTWLYRGSSSPGS